MPPSTATCTIPPRLTVVTRYTVQAVVGDHAAARLDDDAAPFGQQRAGLADHRVGVGVEIRRVLVVGVAHTEAATEVVGVEGAEPGDGLDRRGQLVDVEQLRADVGVHAVEPEHRAVVDAC